MTKPQVQLALFGLVTIGLLLCWKVRGAILIGMSLTALAGWMLGYGQAPKEWVALPFTGDYVLGPIAFQLEIGSILKLSLAPLFLTLFLMVFLDTLATLVGLGAAANLLDDQGDFPQIERPMLVDAGTTVLASLLGTSTSGAFIESATGIREGARTGLAAIVTAACFAISLFFIPLLQPLQHLKYVYAPALIVVGLLMMERMVAIRYSDLTEGIPAALTICLMVFTYNIANGLTTGLALYPLLKLASGRGRELHPGSVLLGVLCLAYLVLGLPH